MGLASLNHFEWKAKYSVHVQVIDNQHKMFLKAMDELYHAIQTNLTTDKILTIFDKLEKYEQLHFATEEKYFKKFNYQDAPAHIEAHRGFSKKLQELKNDLQDEKLTLSFKLLDYMEDWFINHLTNMDQGYVQCFKDHGLK